MKKLWRRLFQKRTVILTLVNNERKLFRNFAFRISMFGYYRHWIMKT